MKSLSIPAVFACAMAFGMAYAQLPEVKPLPEPKSIVAQDVADATITAKVTSALSADPALKDMELTVATTDSVVTINGTANAPDQIAREPARAAIWFHLPTAVARRRKARR